jgi:uncharacterized repeat protein (TIGR03803 family)
LTLSGSTLYGMTYSGGSNNDGMIFSVPVSGGTATTLLSFSGTNGSVPAGDLTLSGSTFYGMTRTGGANGDGTIFRINTDGSGFQDLLSFSGTNGNTPFYGSLTLSGSTLYGMTELGGILGRGNIFSINTDGSDYDDLLDFNGTNGGGPYGSLTLSGSTLYGMTTAGGSNDAGNVFALNLVPTPEPSTFVLLIVGAAALAGYRWRRRAK